MDLDELVPQGAGSLASPVTPPAREPVATFTPTRYLHPDEIWSPRGSEIAPPGRPLPGHGLDHEPVNASERTAGHTAQDADDFHAAAARVRAALRAGDF